MSIIADFKHFCPDRERELLKLTTRKYIQEKKLKKATRKNNMKQETKIYLTTEQLKNFGDSLSDIMNRLEMTNNNIEVLEVIQNSDEIKFDWLARKFLSTTYEQNRQINKLLNDVSFALLECDNEKELEGLKA